MPGDHPVSGVMPVLEMAGEDDEETQRLREMEQRARDFISDFEWCEEIRDFYYGAGVGEVFAVFLAHIRPAQPSVDEYLWIVVGDLPSVYLVTDDCANPKEALEGYDFHPFPSNFDTESHETGPASGAELAREMARSLAGLGDGRRRTGITRKPHHRRGWTDARRAKFMATVIAKYAKLRERQDTGRTPEVLRFGMRNSQDTDPAQLWNRIT